MSPVYINGVEQVVAHAAKHQDAGTDEVSVAALSGELADRQKSKAGTSVLGWTAEKLLKGAGAGVAPTEIDVPAAGGGVRKLFLPATAGYIAAGVAAGVGCYGAVLGADLASLILQFNFECPSDFASLVSVKAVWLSSAAGGNMYWVLEAQYATDGELWNIHSDTPAYGVTATAGANRINIDTPANALTLALLAANDIIGIRFTRDGTHVNDTLSAEVNLMGLLITYNASY